MKHGQLICHVKRGKLDLAGAVSHLPSCSTFNLSFHYSDFSMESSPQVHSPQHRFPSNWNKILRRKLLLSLSRLVSAQMLIYVVLPTPSTCGVFVAATLLADDNPRSRRHCETVFCDWLTTVSRASVLLCSSATVSCLARSMS